jgi:hypothetical protein
MITAGVGLFDRTLRAWDLSTGAEIPSFFPPGTEAPLPGAGKIEVSWRRNVYTAFGPEVVVWEVAGRVARRVATIRDVTSFAVDPRGTRIATGHSDGTIAIVDTTGHVLVRGFVAHLSDAGGEGGRVSALAWSPCGEWIASGSTDGLVRVWRIDP